MKLNIRVHALWLASALILLFAPTSAEAQKALVYCPAVDQSGCTTVKAALTSAFPGGVDMADDGANGTIDLRTADLFQYAVFFVPSLAETDSAAPYARLREQVVADRLKAALIGRRAFWSGTPDQGVLATTRPQKDQLIQNLAAWASADFGTVNAPGLVVLQDNSDVVTQRYSWVQPIVGFQIVADPKLASYNSVRSLTSAGNAILAASGSALAYANMASFGFQTPSGASGVSLDAVGQTGTSVGGQIVLLTQMGANTGGAVIRTDTDDYPPGTPVIMTGTGFQAGETVSLTLHEDPLLHADRVHSATADGNGGFVYSGFAPDSHDVNVRFVLTAKGQSSDRQAQTTFTDANPSNVVLNPNSRTITAGNTASYPLTVSFNGNNNSCSATLQVTTALPAGASASFTPNPISGSSSATSTLSISTTAVTPAGTYSFTVRANSGTDCQNQNSNPIVTGSLTVNAKQNQATVNVINMPPSPQQFGASFTVAANGGSGTGAYSFSATGACSVVASTGVVTMTSGAGVCSVLAIRLGDANFNDSSPSSPATVNATPAIQPAVTLTVPPSVTYPNGFTAIANGGVAGASFTFSTSSLACSVHQTSGVVTILSTGTCAITATANSANYADATDTKTTTVNAGTQPAVTLTLPATTTFPTGATASTSGGAAGATFSYSTLSSACSVVASSGVVTVTSVGACVVTATATAANYADATDTKTMTIGAAATTTVVTVANATFDGSPHGGTALVTGPGGLSQSVTVGYVGRNGTTYPLSTTAPTNAGDYTASATYAAAGNYLGSSDSQDFSIGKATATITVNGFTGPYDGAAHGATGTATGVGGANLTGLNLGASFTDVPGGTATWTFTDATGNYSNATGTANIVISKANQTITFGALAKKTYGDASFAVSATASSGLPVAFGVSGNCSISGSTVTITGAGSCTVAATQAGNGNFNAAVDVPQSFDIDKAKATVTVNGYSGVYDGAAHGATGTATGIAGADLSALLSLGSSFTNVPGGTANWSFAGDANYEAASGTAAITITKANATIDVTGFTGVYDGAVHGAAGTAKGVGGVSLLGLNLGATFTNVPGGTASWTFTDATGNYNDATGSVEITISKADASITVNGYTGVYDGDAHGATGAATGVGGASLAGLDLGASFTNVPGGTATWTFTDATGNYKNATGTAAITITKASPTVNVSGYTGVYDGNAHGATGTVTGVKGELLSGLDLGASFTNVPGGTASWSFTDATGNYDNANGTAAIVLSKANATIAVDGYTGVYDGNAHGATGSAKGVGGISLAGLNVGATFTNVPGGTASWTFTDVTGNYNDATGTAAIVITKADASITVSGYTGVYDGNAHGATGSAKGVLNEILSGLDLGASFTNVPGGTANWTFTDATGNYNDATGTAAIVISQATPTVTAVGGSFTFDASAHPGSGSATGVSAVDLGAVTLTYKMGGVAFAGPPVNAGSYEVTANYAGSTNYTAGSSSAVPIEIAKANAMIAVNGYTGVYDGTAHGATGSAAGVGGVVLAGLDLGATFTNVPGGTASWTFTDVTGNYTNASGTAPITINTRPITVTADAQTKVYGEADPALTYTVTTGSLAGTDAFSGGLTRAPGNPVGAYAIQQGSLTAGTNYALTFAGANLSITARPITVTADAKTKIYGDSDPALTAQVTTGNLVYADVLSGALTRAAGENVGSYAISQGTLTAGTNYVLSYVGANLNVTPRSITLKPTAPDLIWTGSPLTPAYALAVAGGSLGNGDQPTVFLNGVFSPATVTNVGTVASNVTGLTNGNYTIATVPGSVTVIDKTSPIGAITQLNPVAIGTTPVIKLNFTDVATGNSNIVSWQYRYDNAAFGAPIPVNPQAPNVNITANLPSSSTTDVIRVCVQGTDAGGNTSGEYCALLAVYDPSAGFVTGGGWIDSPAGAYVADPMLSGKANFGFVAKYQKGANVPTGNTEFQFKEGNLTFSSTSFEWLVVQGASQAQYKGTGTINGNGSYKFMVTAIDGDEVGGAKKSDAFRIKITTAGGGIVYDNKINSPDTSFDATSLGGGSIQIHSK